MSYSSEVVCQLKINYLYLIYFLLVSFVVTDPVLAAEEICAKSYSELNQTSRLQTLKSILPHEGKRGFVNQTKGSFLYIESKSESFKIFFLTTGLFDLYSIVREGAVVFCDNGESLVIDGLGKKRTLLTIGKGIQFGNGGASESFQPGPVPKPLREIHGEPILD